MPEITVRPGIPCPQTSTVTVVDSRLITEGEHPRVQGRTIERDERQVQSVTWALNTEQAAAFRAWWTIDLVFGGAWFSAPDTWPTPEGLVVKVRRFIDPPSFQYQGVGNWLVSAVLEVRGRTLLPTDGPPPSSGESDIVLQNSVLAAMLYGEAYLAAFPVDLEAFSGEEAVGFSGAGPGIELYTVDEATNGIRAPLEVVGSGQSITRFVGNDVFLAAEFTIESKPDGARIAVGAFAGSFGPAGDLSQFLVGWPSLCAYWTSDGSIAGYGTTPISAPTYDAGDVIGIVIAGESLAVFFFKNGVAIEETAQLGDNAAVSLIASMQPL